MRTKKALKFKTHSLKGTRTKLLRIRRRRRRRRAAQAISSSCFINNSAKVSTKLKALKNLIPSSSSSSHVNNGGGEATVNAEHLFQETADYIILLRTRVLLLQSLIHFYGSDENQQNDNVNYPNKTQSAVWKVQANVNEVVAKQPLNSTAAVDAKSEVALPEEKVESAEKKIPDASAISAFITQVSDLVKLVDSRDIIELQMKQADCELIIRKKEALQPPAPVVNMPHPMPHMMYPTPTPAAPAAAPASAPTPAPANPASSAPPALPPPAKKPSHPPLKCPMAGTFYRCPAPGEPPFVKVGDKVQKGQVVCIIEAMKLMNEIEADQSGTVTEILAEDGKPVSVDTPLFVIVP